MKETLPEYMLREKLQGYASPVDAGLLDRVMQARRQEKGRPSAFWWLLPIALLLGGAAISYLGKDGSFPGRATVSQSPDPESSNYRDRTHAQLAPAGNMHAITPDQAGEISRTRDKVPEMASRHETIPGTPITGNSLTNSEVHSKTGGRAGKPGKNNAIGTFGDRSGHEERISRDAQREMQNLETESAFSGMTPSLFTNRLPPVHLFIPGCPDLGIEKRNDWYVEAFIGPDLPRKTLSDAWDKSGFAEKKDSTESFLLSYSAGIRVSKNISTDWLVKTGIHYSQFNEKFEYRNETEKRITTVITIRTVIRGPGDTLLVRDTSQVEVTGTRVKTTYNRYRNIDIPLLLSYEMRKPGFTLAVNGGVTFNILSAFHGDMIDTSGAPMSDAGKNAATQLKSRLGLGLYAGLSFIKPVSPSLDVFAEPYYRRYLNNQATDAAPFKQYVSNWGIQLGIRYHLNASGQRY